MCSSDLIWELPPELGSTGHWPVPPGDSPGGTGGSREKFRTSSGMRNRSRVPFGGSPNGAGESPAPPISESTFLADLAEAVIGQRLGESGNLEPAPSHRLGELRQQFSGQPVTNAFTRWLAWFLADRSTRTISPNSPITVPEYVTRRMEEKTLAAASEAVLLAPTNAPALAHLAVMLLTSPGSNAPVVVAEAEFLIRRAETLASSDASVQDSRRRIERQLDQRSPR